MQARNMPLRPFAPLAPRLPPAPGAPSAPAAPLAPGLPLAPGAPLLPGVPLRPACPLTPAHTPCAHHVSHRATTHRPAIQNMHACMHACIHTHTHTHTTRRDPEAFRHSERSCEGQRHEFPKLLVVCLGFSVQGLGFRVSGAACGRFRVSPVNYRAILLLL